MTGRPIPETLTLVRADGTGLRLSPDSSAIVLSRQDGKTIAIYVLELGA
ncbi:MAG TPA: hypothetical protein VII86_05950 [Thermoanaerobaculia bacterium]